MHDFTAKVGHDDLDNHDDAHDLQEAFIPTKIIKKIQFHGTGIECIENRN